MSGARGCAGVPRLLATLPLALFVGCLPRAATLPPPKDLGAITIVPPENRTGDELLVAGGSLSETYLLRAERLTVPDVLAAETETLLRARGYRARLAEPEAGPTGLRLTIEVRRWEPDSWTHPAFVIAGVRAALTDAQGRELWSAAPAVHPVATPGAVIPGAAYDTAARSLVRELFASWPAR